MWPCLLLSKPLRNATKIKFSVSILELTLINAVLKNYYIMKINLPKTTGDLSPPFVLILYFLIQTKQKLL